MVCNKAIYFLIDKIDEAKNTLERSNQLLSLFGYQLLTASVGFQFEWAIFRFSLLFANASLLPCTNPLRVAKLTVDLLLSIRARAYPLAVSSKFGLMSLFRGKASFPSDTNYLCLNNKMFIAFKILGMIWCKHTTLC